MLQADCLWDPWEILIYLDYESKQQGLLALQPLWVLKWTDVVDRITYILVLVAYMLMCTDYICYVCSHT
jgi:hypothetical protein